MILKLWSMQVEDDESWDEEEDVKREKKTGAYVPPKLVAMQYGKV